MLVHPSGEYLDQVLRPMAELEPDELTLGSELDLSVDAFADQWSLARGSVQGSAALGHKLNHDWMGGEPMLAYLRELDYVALSWYVSDWRPLPEGYVIGEMGLGSIDASRPWHFDASTFGDDRALALRRDWYLRLLAWLRQQDSPKAACFWTAGHFDVLGIMNRRWRDDAVVEAVVQELSP